MHVLANDTPVSRYFNIFKNIEDDTQFDPRRAQKKLRMPAENDEYAIPQKAGIIVDHFNESIFVPKGMGGQGRPGPWSSSTAWTGPDGTTTPTGSGLPRMG